MSRMDTSCDFEMLAAKYMALNSDYNGAQFIEIGPMVLKL